MEEGPTKSFWLGLVWADCIRGEGTDRSVGVNAKYHVSVLPVFPYESLCGRPPEFKGFNVFGKRCVPADNKGIDTSAFNNGKNPGRVGVDNCARIVLKSKGFVLGISVRDGGGHPDFTAMCSCLSPTGRKDLVTFLGGLAFGRASFLVANNGELSFPVLYRKMG